MTTSQNMLVTVYGQSGALLKDLLVGGGANSWASFPISGNDIPVGNTYKVCITAENNASLDSFQRYTHLDTSNEAATIRFPHFVAPCTYSPFSQFNTLNNFNHNT